MRQKVNRKVRVEPIVALKAAFLIASDALQHIYEDSPGSFDGKRALRDRNRAWTLLEECHVNTSQGAFLKAWDLRKKLDEK
jgi:hypothetical protein